MLARMAKASIWAGRVSAWRESGKSAVKFCADKDFSMSSLTSWAKRLREEATVTGVPEPTQSPADTTIRIARLMPAPSPRKEAETPIVLEAAGVRIAVRRGFDHDVLRQILEVLTLRGGLQ
jgi:hypothetical protein